MTQPTKKMFTLIARVDPKSETIFRALMQEISEQTNSSDALAFPPHITIRNDFEVEAKNLEGLVNDLNSLIDNFTTFDIQTDHIGYYPWKLFYLEVLMSPPLQKLHHECMQTIQKYRTNWVAPHLLQNPNYAGKQKEYIRQYGYHFSFEYYHPHITLAGNDISDSVFQKLKDLIGQKRMPRTARVVSIDLIDRSQDNTPFHTFYLKK
jgi:2'-5' RNA ligase